jgi:hypothetical protein
MSICDSFECIEEQRRKQLHFGFLVQASKIKDWTGNYHQTGKKRKEQKQCESLKAA